jgi:serine/threonine protein kinase
MTRAEPRQPTIIGEFGPFLLVRQLGSGGMGTVYLVRSPWPDHPIAALKRGLVGDDPAVQERFRHEMELAVRLEHPNLIQAFDVGSVGGEPYVCSELILGKDLGAIFKALDKKRAVGPFAIALSIMIDVLHALHYVHNARSEQGTPLRLVHRDVKPGNIILGYDGVARVADFGAATSALTSGLDLTKPGEIVGTPATVAPDVLRMEPATPASDVYALGTVVYRFVAGVHPHEAGSTRDVLMNVLHADARPLHKYRPDLPSWFIDVVHRMLANDARSRPNSADILRLIGVKRGTPGGLPPFSKDTVGHWLKVLFRDAYDAEVAEFDEVQQLTIEESYAIAKSSVLARRGTESRFESKPLDAAARIALDSIPEPEKLPPTVTMPANSRGLTVKASEPGGHPSDLAAASAEEEDGVTTSPGIVSPVDFFAGSVTEQVDFVDATVLDRAKGRPAPTPSRGDSFADETPPAAMPNPDLRPLTFSIRPSSDVHEEVHSKVDPASTQPGKVEVQSASPRSEPTLQMLSPVRPPTTAVDDIVIGDPYTSDAIVSPANISVAVPDPAGAARKRLDSPRWATMALVVAGVAIGLSAFAALYALLNDDITAVIPAEGTVHVPHELKEELNRRRVEMRARVQDGESIPQEAWLALDRASASVEAGDAGGARRALAELKVYLMRRNP